ncbi:MAG: hypothetical protein OXH08_07190 [Gammaproteobacteria bacterium]|nr:hypothetical protein [Gammaproteobacteria bacterium]MDE2716111.1 hypothetical protein [Chloroflexota bacterium]
MNYFKALLTSRTHSLFLPAKWKDDIQRYVRQHQQGGSSNPEAVPFGRQLDFWALSFATAVARGVAPLETPPAQGGHKFVDTRAVELSAELCELLAVVALGTLGPDDEGVEDPARIIELANQYAAAGCEELLLRLRDPDLRLSTLDKAINFATELVLGAQQRRSP